MTSAENLFKAGNGRITEALELLNETAREKKDELKGLLTDKYSHIKQVMVAGTEQGKQALDRAKHLTQDAIAEGEDKIKEVVSEADKRVRTDPWLYITGAAAFSLLLGYLMGSKHK